MYPSGIGGIGVASGGVLAATGFMFAGYVWAGLIILILGVVLIGLGTAREVALRRRLAARTAGDIAGGPTDRSR